MNGALVVIDAGSPLPPYEQIASQIRMQIAAGYLQAGDELPSVRQLGRDLDVAPNTIVRAYNQLVQEGWLETARRRGFKVAHHLPVVITEERTRQFQNAVAQLLTVVEQLRVTPEELYSEIERQWKLLYTANK